MWMMIVNNNLQFDQLVDLFRLTHQETQYRASRTVDTYLVVRNWLFGWYIVEFENGNAGHAELYGQALMMKLAKELGSPQIKGISITSLKQCRRFYNAYKLVDKAASTMTFEEEKMRQALSASSSLTLPFNAMREFIAQLMPCFTLGWSHYVTLLTIDNSSERRFYEIEATANSWSVRELDRQIASSLYERLALSRNRDEIRQLAEQGLVIEKAADIIKNPLVLEFLGLEERASYSEYELEAAIINKIEHFLLELGKGFLFEARQKRFTFDNDHFYVDLVFYNRLLRCYVLIDLKRDKLTHQDLGQMQMYVNYFDRYVKTEDELPTIGIVLCHRKNDALVELTLPKDANIFASKYQLYLPSKEELKRQLEQVESELGDMIND
jgi:predicted nuclease of restriction endonuclease-like (RecB) superfamily